MHDMELYMGMLGHAAFVKDDGSVFRARASIGIGADGCAGAGESGRLKDHSMHDMARHVARGG